MKHTILPLLLVVAMSGIGFADQTGSGVGGPITDDAVPNLFTISIGPSETISDVEITLFGLDHTWVGDLVMSLTSPGGTSISIMDGIGSADNTGAGDSSNFFGDYSFSDAGGDIWAAAAAAATSADIVAPGDYFASSIDGSMLSFATTFDGDDTSGDWTLSITDRTGLDTGLFDSWEIRITSTAVIPEPSSMVVVGIVGLVGLVRRRRV